MESVPIVYALSPSTDPADTSVVSDDQGGARLAVDHLLATGRTRIAHVTGPEHHAAARDRARRTIEHLEHSSRRLATGRVHFGEWSEAWGRRAADAVLRTAPDTDAFFCGNDQIARGVTDTLRERGVSVPGDIAVVGYDNWDTMALASRPPLTTIDMDLAEIGRIAACACWRPSTRNRHRACTPCRAGWWCASPAERHWLHSSDRCPALTSHECLFPGPLRCTEPNSPLCDTWANWAS
ncbi:substrate-binding domain-containing protein [Streptomyces sp. NPDC051104]|uniref:substrate-binding domain-containing protein n=1 Tax=Streptomyces sp. NPDC051104 TaxID=3155044 RepID=UPI00341C3F2D